RRRQERSFFPRARDVRGHPEPRIFVGHDCRAGLTQRQIRPRDFGKPDVLNRVWARPFTACSKAVVFSASPPSTITTPSDVASASTLQPAPVNTARLSLNGVLPIPAPPWAKLRNGSAAAPVRRVLINILRSGALMNGSAILLKEN